MRVGEQLFYGFVYHSTDFMNDEVFVVHRVGCVRGHGPGGCTKLVMEVAKFSFAAFPHSHNTSAVESVSFANPQRLGSPTPCLRLKKFQLRPRHHEELFMEDFVGPPRVFGRGVHCTDDEEGSRAFENTGRLWGVHADIHKSPNPFRMIARWGINSL